MSGLKQVKINSHSDEQLKNLKNKHKLGIRAKSTMAGHVDDTRNSKALSLGKKQKSGCSERSESLSDMHTRSKNKLVNIPTQSSLQSIPRIPEEEMDLHILDKYLLEGKEKSPYKHHHHKIQNKTSTEAENKRAHRLIEN